MGKQAQKQDMQDVCAMMGLALTLLHEIEQELAEAFYVGLTEKQKKKHPTVNDLIAARSKMTFGQLVNLMKEQWQLDHGFDRFLDAFVDERNQFVHSLTTQEGFGILRKRDRNRLRKRLGHFINQAFLAKRLFRAARYTTVDFAQYWLKKHEGVDLNLPKIPEIEREIDVFLGLLGELRSNPGVEPTPKPGAAHAER